MTGYLVLAVLATVCAAKAAVSVRWARRHLHHAAVALDLGRVHRGDELRSAAMVEVLFAAFWSVLATLLVVAALVVS